jgi:hypothetical protein
MQQLFALITPLFGKVSASNIHLGVGNPRRIILKAKPVFQISKSFKCGLRQKIIFIYRGYAQGVNLEKS